MWTNSGVSLSDVLEVRGSNLKEDEAWSLLLEIGKQLKNVPFSSCKDQIITPSNVQIHSTGGVSINFSLQCPDNFTDFYQTNNIDSLNALPCSLGMTILWWLQNGIPSGEYLNISDELHSTLTMMTSNNATLQSLEELISSHHNKVSSSVWKYSTAECFRKMYKSILGRNSMKILHESETQILQEEFDKKSEIINEFTENPHSRVHSLHPQSSCNITPDSHSNSPSEIINQPVNEHVHEELNSQIIYNLSQQIGHTSDMINRDHGHDLHHHHDGTKVETEEQFIRENQTSPNFMKEKPRNKIISKNQNYKSILNNDSSPIQINLCTERKDIGKASNVTVQYLDGRKVVAMINTAKASCGQLLSVSASQLAFSTNYSLFGLTIFHDEEYVFLENSAIINKISPIHGMPSNNHFFLRLKFLPQEIYSGDKSLLQAVYLQIRRDVMDGRIVCDHEQAMLLATYSMQFELGDLTNASDEHFRAQDFLSSNVIEALGNSYVHHTLPRLHVNLKGTPVTSARDMYISKARQLNDFGTHFLLVYLSRKCLSSASSWLAISPRGLKIFRIQQGNARKIIHQYSWEKLVKIAFKKTAVSLNTKEGIKLKFYVKKERKSKYIVRIMGEMHQFHRFDDFHNVDSFQCNNNATTKIKTPPRIMLPFKRTSNALIHRQENSPEGNSNDLPTIRNETSHLEIFSEVPEIIPYISDNDCSESEESEMEIAPVQLVSPDYEEVELNFSSSENDKQDTDETNSVFFNEEPEETEVFDVNELPPPLIHELYGEFQVDLEKINGTFGFSILGGSDKQIGLIKVYQIVPGGAADRNGTIQSDDVILSINDTMLFNVTHKDAVEIMGDAPKKSKLHIRREGVLRIESLPSPTQHEVQVPEVKENEEVFDENIQFEAAAESDNTTSIDINNQISTYDDRVSQVATAFYNYQYTDIESEFQHQYIGNGDEDLSLKDEHHQIEEDLSRGEGDGISNFSGPDHHTSTSQSVRPSDDSSQSKRNIIPEATANTITDFEDFRRRLSSLKNANESSTNSGDNESWSTDHE